MLAALAASEDLGRAMRDAVDTLTRFRQGAALPDDLTFLGFEITR